MIIFVVLTSKQLNVIMNLYLLFLDQLLQTWKVRVPIGKLMLELPAGMLDDDKGDIVGTAVREVSSLHLLCYYYISHIT